MGRRKDRDLPAVELIGGEPSIETTQQVSMGRGPTSPRSRARLVLGVAVVALGVVAAMTWGDGGEPTPAAEETTTTRPTTTTTRDTTTLPTTTTTEPPIGPAFDTPSGGSILLYLDGISWHTMDLDTGVEGRPKIDSEFGITPVRGGVVSIGRNNTAVFVGIPSGEVVELGRSDGVYATPDRDQVWLLDGSGNSEGGVRGSMHARLVDLDGHVVRELDLVAPYLAGVTETALVYPAGGRIFVAEATGTRSLIAGELHGMDRGVVLAQICNDVARCHMAAVNASTDQIVTLEGLNVGVDSGYFFTVADDGRMAAFDYAYEGGTPHLSLFDADGNAIASGAVPSDGYLPSWLPGNLGMLMPSGDGYVRITVDGEGLLVTTVPALDSIRPSDSYLISPAS